MKHYIKTTLFISLVGLLAVWVANLYGQATIDQTQRINFRADAPLSPRPTASSAGGQTQYNYWVVANFPIGSALPGGPTTHFGPATLSGSNPVRITWAAVGGATTYDVLRSPTPASPLTNGACVACAVATGLTGTSQSDTGGALGAYTLGSTIPQAAGYFYLDNRDASSPRFVVNPPIVGPSGASSVFIDVDGTPSATGNGEIVFLGATGLEGTTRYIYDTTTGSVTQQVLAANEGLNIRSAFVQPDVAFEYSRGTLAAPLYPGVGDGLGIVHFDGFNQNTGSYELGAGIIVDAFNPWSATNNDASMDLHINETNTVGSGVTILTLQPDSMGVGVGYGINQLTGGLDGDLHVADNRAVTGDTEVVIQAGAGQAAAFLQIQDNAGSGIASIDVTGGFRPVSVLFAALGTPADGVMVYCSDCDAASSPCASTPGTGAFAFRQGGAWSCQ